MPKERIIIGIDPGTTVMGYGILKINGNKPELITLGILQLNKFDNHYMKLRRIFERVLGLIDQYHPDEMAIECAHMADFPDGSLHYIHFSNGISIHQTAKRRQRRQ